MGVSGVTLPADDPIEDEPSYATALAAFEALPPVRVRFDNGAGGTTPGLPDAGFEQSFAGFPVPGTLASSWYLGTGGTLNASAFGGREVDAFTWDPRARPRRPRLQREYWRLRGRDAGNRWTQNPPEPAPYLTAPLTSNVVVIGGALSPGSRLHPRHRPPGDGERGSSRWHGDVRPERLARGPASASSIAPRARCSIPCSPFAAPTRGRSPRADSRRWRSRSTTRDTCTGRGRGFGSRSRPRAAISRPGRSVISCRVSVGHGAVGVFGVDAVAARAAGRAGGGRPHRLAAVSGIARRAVPRIRAAREPNCQLNRRSRTRATPESSLAAVTSSAAAITCG